MKQRARSFARLHYFAALATAFAACLGATRLAHASQPTPTLVFEVHVGPRSSATTGYLATLRDELERYGFAARPETIEKRLAGRLPRPGVLDPGTTAATIAREVDAGYDAFTKGQFQEAVDKLRPATRLINRNPALLVLDTGNASVVFKAYVGLALSEQSLGNTREGDAAMAELIRISSQPITKSSHGPLAAQFYTSMSKQVQTKGRGRLTIMIDNQQVMIFVEGQIRGTGTATLGDLIPGTYHVFLRAPDGIGRQYELEVRADAEATLEVPWSADSMLTATDEWFGYQLATEFDRQKEATLAGDAVQRWRAGDMVATIGTMKLQGKLAIVATLYHLNGKIERFAGVPLDDIDDAKLRSLAQFIADGTPNEDIQIVENSPGGGAPTSQHDHDTGVAGADVPSWPKAVLGVSAVVLAGSTTLYLAWPDDDHTKPEYDDKKTLAVKIYSGAAGVAGVGTYSWLTKSRHMSRLPAAMFGAATTSLLLAAMYIPTDEDVKSAPAGYRQRPTYRDTGLAGGILAGTGVAFVATGYLLTRGDHGGRDQATAMPVMSVGRNGWAIGWTGRF